MSNAKPYLFGTLLGASAMYVALQYHVVHSHDGFQMVPRTPQHSVGLAYADVRSWTPSQWTDRPELARALMAHGSSDLISQSVATSLADSVAEENSTLDQLRSFLSKPAQDTAGGAAAGLLQIPGASRQPLNVDSGSSDELNPLPFPRDAMKPVLADPFAPQVAQSEDRAITSDSKGSVVPSTSPGTSRFSAAEIIEDLRREAGSPVDSFNNPAKTATAGTNSSGTATAKPSSTSQFTQAMEDQMFGNPAPATKSTGSPKPATSDVGQSMFEEVSSQLESRAQAALNRAQSAATEKAGNVLSDGTAATQNYLRQRVEQAAPDAVKSLIQSGSNGSTEKAAQTGGSLLDQFDPFLE